MINLSDRYWNRKKGTIGDQSPKSSADRSLVVERFHNFASQHLPKNQPRDCPCGSLRDHPIISNVDRNGWPLELKLCTECGLIYVGKYWNEHQLAIYYKDWYRLTYEEGKKDPELLFTQQIKSSLKRNRYSRVKQFLPEKETISVVDVGGACGGALLEFQNHGHHCVVADYDLDHLEFARAKGITTVEGGLDALHKSGIKYDLAILNHVVEHFFDLNDGLLKLNNILSKNGMIWIELPALDSLLEGRRSYDFLGDIQDAHTFYFTIETLTYHLGRHGFKPIFTTTESEALFYRDISSIDLQRPPQRKQPLNTVSLLRRAENLRKYALPARRALSIIKSQLNKIGQLYSKQS